MRLSTMAVRNQLKNDQDFVALEEKDDVIGLLEKLRALAYETDRASGTSR